MSMPVAAILKELRGPLTHQQAEAIWARGKEAVILALMLLSLQALGAGSAPDAGPNAPPSSVPTYAKPARRRRGKRPGAKPGHPGHRRALAETVTRRVQHPPLERCPDCGGPLCKPTRHRVRRIEDIPEVFPELTEHTIPRQWCPACGREVEPVVDEAMPKASLGHAVVTLSAWLHYGLGVTISQVIAVLSHHVHIPLSEGGLVGAWQRLGEVLSTWYDQIGQQVKLSGVLHADETGWRLNGKPHWLWCCTTKGATYYMIDRSRGSPALKRFFTEAFDGVLVTDFWSAYGAVSCWEHQACLAHLLRELAHVDERDKSRQWRSFSKKLGRLLRDGLRLKAHPDLPCEQRKRRTHLIDRRLMCLVQWHSSNANVQRLVKRLSRYRDSLFTFLDYEDVPADNNRAEREIRPAVIIRKNSLCNRSEAGAQTQAVLMSIYRTLKARGREPMDTIVAALKAYVRTGSLPPLPQ
jgi:transposase